MLNRSQTVKRLIEIRRLIYDRGQQNPDKDDRHLKDELERLIKDLIGSLDPERDRLINKILLKAFSGEVTTDMAMVAIHEVVLAEMGKSVKQKMPARKTRKRESKEELMAKGYK